MDTDRIGRFFSLLIDILDKDNNNELMDDELEAFEKILRIAAVTGNDTPEIEIKKGTSVSRSRLEELTRTVNIEACRHLVDLIRSEGGVEPILRDRSNEVSIVANFGRPDKLKIEFNENSNGKAFTVWCEARATFFENLPNSFQEILDHRSKKRTKPIVPNKVSSTGKNMYFQFTALNDNIEDQEDIAALLRACKNAE